MAYSTNTSGGTQVPFVPTSLWMRAEGLKRLRASYVLHEEAIVGIEFKSAVRSSSTVEAAEMLTARQKPGTLLVTPQNETCREETTTTRTHQLEDASAGSGSLTNTTAVIAA